MSSPRPFRTLCYVSDAFRFIWVLVPKNASSSIRTEFEGDPYRATLAAYHDEVDPEIRRAYLTFAVLRDPVDRALSAYQEVSFRAERRPGYLAEAAFLSFPDGPARFGAFLDEVERGPWDGHVKSQSHILAGVRVDAWGCVESLQTDLERILARVGVDAIPPLERHRPRSQLIARRPGALDLRREHLGPELVSRIRSIYREDAELYRRVAAPIGGPGR